MASPLIVKARGDCGKPNYLGCRKIIGAFTNAMKIFLGRFETASAKSRDAVSPLVDDDLECLVAIGSSSTADNILWLWVGYDESMI
jgi:hypothetical protein